jgi:hypothetical protein
MSMMGDELNPSQAMAAAMAEEVDRHSTAMADIMDAHMGGPAGVAMFDADADTEPI